MWVIKVIINEETIKALIEMQNDLNDCLVTDLTSLKNYFNLVEERIELLESNWHTSGSKEMISSMKNISNKISGNTDMISWIGDISNIKVNAEKVSKVIKSESGNL